MKNTVETSNYEYKKTEGEVNVDYIPSENNTKSDFKDSGEYVDFEEIDEKDIKE
ncbi:MAG: hypothetical protein WHW07_04300 [Bacteroidales bacterium]|jgi:hypothetical protein|nr:hypothetical protein [Bacteroidales bacterium]HOL98227.1 hypothetical protein [Bacteroidales bacterium]HOM36450.1 hypothetical protein [Bacteroidales bacterium]HPD23876.1 hypothetical protein [Bacteroidales bacterium]HRS99947.1 hypothetical protein [Bacteroidales bacterium]